MTLVVRKYPVALQDSPITAEVMRHLPHPSPAERQRLLDEIRRLLKAKDAVLVAHYYVHEDLQRLAEETGGYVSDSLDMARFGVRANAILPGWIETDMTANAIGNEKFAKNVLPRIPMRRWGTKEDFAGIAVYLMSDASGYHTGDSFVIDGACTIF